MKKYRVTVNGTAYEIELEELTGETYYYCFAAGLDGYHPPFDADYAPTQGKALYGNAIVSKYPILNFRTVKVAVKEQPVAAGGYEHRVFLIAEVKVDDCTLFVKGEALKKFEEAQIMFPVLAHA